MTRLMPVEKQIAYFVHLHLDTLRKLDERTSVECNSVYRVEGKPRPMLVLRRLPKRERGKQWFFVLPITKQGLDEQGKKRSDVEWIGNCIDRDTKSFVKLERHKLPENMLSGGQPVVPCDPLAFSNAIKVLEHKMMGGP